MSEVLVSSVERVIVDIPIEARLSFAELDAEHTEWRHAAKIAEEIGTYDKKITRIAEDLQLPTERRVFEVNGQEAIFYPPYTGALIREEIRWREDYRSLPSLIPKSVIVESVGRSYGWTTNTLDEYGYKPNKAGLYPKTALRFIRHISMSVPLDEGWYNVRQLVDYTGLDREWVERRLNDHGVASQQRRSTLTGKILNFYPPDSLDLVMEAAAIRAKPGGEWLTVNAIAGKIDKNYKWVERRLQQHSHLAVGKLDDQGVERKHFAPSIVEMLREESGRQKKLPDGTEYLSVHKLARRMGHATAWAQQILFELGEEATEVRSATGGTRFGYHIDLMDRIRSYDENRASQPKVTADDLLISLFKLGSIKSKIRAQKQLRRTLKGFPAHSVKEQLDSVNQTAKSLGKELRAENQRLNRALAKTAFLPGFITGIKNPR